MSKGLQVHTTPWLKLQIGSWSPVASFKLLSQNIFHLSDLYLGSVFLNERQIRDKMLPPLPEKQFTTGSWFQWEIYWAFPMFHLFFWILYMCWPFNPHYRLWVYEPRFKFHAPLTELTLTNWTNLTFASFCRWETKTQRGENLARII